VVRALDSCRRRRWFDFRPVLYQVTTLGKFFTSVRARVGQARRELQRGTEKYSRGVPKHFRGALLSPLEKLFLNVFKWCIYFERQRGPQTSRGPGWFPPTPFLRRAWRRCTWSNSWFRLETFRLRFDFHRVSFASNIKQVANLLCV